MNKTRTMICCLGCSLARFSELCSIGTMRLKKNDSFFDKADRLQTDSLEEIRSLFDDGDSAWS